MKYFELDQYVIIWFNRDYDHIYSDTEEDKKSAIELAKNSILRDLQKVKNKFAENHMEHATIGARVYDNLCRSKYFTYIELLADESFKISREPLDSEKNILK